MKNSLKKLLLGGAAVLALGVGADAHAQTSDTGTINTEATVIQGISVTGATDLDFGGFVPPAAGGNLVLDNANGRTGTGFFLPTASPGVSGVFSIDADPTIPFNLQASATVLSGPGADMSISAITLAGGDGTETGPVDVSGAAVSGFSTTAAGGEDFTVGATLVVNASQLAGDYAGTLDLTATYE